MDAMWEKQVLKIAYPSKTLFRCCLSPIIIYKILCFHCMHTLHTWTEKNDTLSVNTNLGSIVQGHLLDMYLQTCIDEVIYIKYFFVIWTQLVFILFRWGNRNAPSKVIWGLKNVYRRNSLKMRLPNTEPGEKKGSRNKYENEKWLLMLKWSSIVIPLVVFHTVYIDNMAMNTITHFTRDKNIHWSLLKCCFKEKGQVVKSMMFYLNFMNNKIYWISIWNIWTILTMLYTVIHVLPPLHVL